MGIGSYIKSKQPLVYKTFSYALSHDQLAHAYLLSGEAGTPLKETAIFLAKSILCDNPNPLADEECVHCRRIDLDEYPDYIFLDGEESSVKKEEVANVVSMFQQTPLEAKGVMIYVIHQVENMTPEAVNSLLKFLEEPTPDTYAILTTQNEEKVLPTILSRCEKLRLLLSDRETVVQEALALGVSQEDTEVLSYFYNAGEIVLTKSKLEEYQAIREAFKDLMSALSQNVSYARFIVHNRVTPCLNSKPALRFFFDLLSLAFKDMVSSKGGGRLHLPCYDTMIRDAAKKLPHVEESLLAIMTLRAEIEWNVNPGLLLTHLISVITKEQLHG